MGGSPPQAHVLHGSETRRKVNCTASEMGRDAALSAGRGTGLGPHTLGATCCCSQSPSPHSRGQLRSLSTGRGAAVFLTLYL